MEKNKKKRPLYKRVLSTVLAASIAVGSMVTTASAAVKYEVSAELDNITNVMKDYGFIAFDDLKVGGHQHMSTIANKITGLGSELCMRDEYGATVSYIREFAELSDGMKFGYKKDTLIVGEQYKVTSNGNENFIDGHKVESAGIVKADTAENKYVDIETLQKSFEQYSKQLSAMKDTEGVTVSGQWDDQNKTWQNINKLDVTAQSGAVVYTINKDNYFKLNNDTVINFPEGSTAVAVINVDMNGLGTQWNRKALKLTVDGKGMSLGEDVARMNVNRIYYNFYDSSAKDGVFTGSVDMPSEGWGTVIVPDGSYSCSANWCGVVIANDISASGEHHFSGAYNPIAPQSAKPDTSSSESDSSSKSDIDSSTPDSSMPEPAVTVKDIKLVKILDANGVDGDQTAAVFGLYSDEACTAEIAKASPVLEDGRYIVTFAGTDLTTATNYYLKEVSAPEGYEKSETVFKCAVDANGDAVYTVLGSSSTVSDTIGNDGLPICENVKTPVAPKTASVQFNKVTASNTALEGATFGLYSDGLCASPVMRDGKAYTFTSDENGVVVFNDLEAGTYYFKELNAPAGYKPNTKVYAATISFDDNGTGVITFTDGKNSGLTKLTVPNDPITAEAVKLSKSYEGKNYDKLSQAEKDELVSSTVFTLYSDAALTNVIGTSKPVEEGEQFVVTFDDDSKITVPTEAGAFKHYYLKETTSPDGYKLSVNVYDCRIDNNGKVTYRVASDTDASFTENFPECVNYLAAIEPVDSSEADSSSAAPVDSSVADSDSAADASSEADSSAVAPDSSSTVDSSSSEADSSSAVDSSSSEADSSSTVDSSSSEADSSSAVDSSSSVADSSSAVDSSSSEADSSSTVDSSSSEADSSSTVDSSSSEADSSSTVDSSSSEADSSSTVDSSSSEADSSSNTDSSSEADTSSSPDESSSTDSSSSTVDPVESSEADSTSSSDSSSDTDSSSSSGADSTSSSGSSSANSSSTSSKASDKSVAGASNNNPHTGAVGSLGITAVIIAAATMSMYRSKKNDNDDK